MQTVCVGGAGASADSLRRTATSVPSKQTRIEFETRSELLICAKVRPFWAHHDISTLPLHLSTWCLITDPATNFSTFELLAACQQKERSGLANYRDVDKGLGIHPAADQDWARRLVQERQKLELGDYTLLQVLSRPRDLMTVLLVVSNHKKKALLAELRKSDNNEAVRLPLSRFLRAGGSEKAVLQMLSETRKGREIVARRRKREYERRRRARCKKRLQRMGQTKCEADAVKNGISFHGSNNVYALVSKTRDMRSVVRTHTSCCCAVQCIQ